MELGDEFQLDAGVAVENYYVFAARGLDARVDGGGKTEIIIKTDESYIGILFARQLGRPIGRRGIDESDLDVVERLFKERVHTLREERLAVVIRNYSADKILFHLSSSLTAYVRDASIDNIERQEPVDLISGDHC